MDFQNPRGHPTLGDSDGLAKPRRKCPRPIHSKTTAPLPPVAINSLPNHQLVRCHHYNVLQTFPVASSKYIMHGHSHVQHTQFGAECHSFDLFRLSYIVQIAIQSRIYHTCAHQRNQIILIFSYIQ